MHSSDLVESTLAFTTMSERETFLLDSNSCFSWMEGAQACGIKEEERWGTGVREKGETRWGKAHRTTFLYLFCQALHKTSVLFDEVEPGLSSSGWT